jgi:DNA mismatch repair protein MutS
MQAKMTPLMQQYWEIKSQHADEILLFRMGDFFEMFHADAEIAAPILNITLTQRNKKADDPTKMCGVPHHSIAGPIAKLLQAGHKVALCDQIEDPATAKGLVKRAVTRVLTPGMVYDPDTLDQLSANYLCSYDDESVAAADVTTGETFIYDFSGEEEREEILALLHPAELVLTGKQILKREGLALKVMTSALDVKFEGPDAAAQRLKCYIEKMQGAETLRGLAPFERRQRRTALRLSAASLRHLEVFENSRGESQGSLFEAINRTKTSAGARLLKAWLTHPLRQLEELHNRQAEIQLWREPSAPLKEFRQALVHLGDVERRLGKVHGSTFNGRDLKAIAQSILAGRGLGEIHPARVALPELSACAALAEEIERCLVDEPPLAVKEGGLIRRGAVAELDELIDLTQNAQKHLVQLEAREREATGISSLKVRYNNVFGFYIELTKTHAHKAPKHYRRKQTLANAERYTTDELDQLEDKILSAKSRRDQMEFEIFSGLRQRVVELTPDLLRLSRVWTRWDLLSALAWLSLERGYTCPRFNDGGRLHLELSRHPAVEQSLSAGFVPNTISLMPGEGLLLTGPNMAGKSTLMRQVALIAVMAQIGSFVPADAAELPLFEDVFTRIGASDALSEGLSTFMVEMTETAQILKRAGPRSLVIMDEIGRGTSTYDGLSLAQAVLEHLMESKKPYLMFATHYHELTQLDQVFSRLRNAHMTVQEKGGQIQFLHTLREGPANRSYGIHVAKLAGLPTSVTSRAGILLKGFEAGRPARQMTLEEAALMAARQSESEAPAWLEEMKSVDVSRMTPLEALNKLSEWQREVSS